MRQKRPIFDKNFDIAAIITHGEIRNWKLLV